MFCTIKLWGEKPRSHTTEWGLFHYEETSVYRIKWQDSRVLNHVHLHPWKIKIIFTNAGNRNPEDLGLIYAFSLRGVSRVCFICCSMGALTILICKNGVKLVASLWRIVQTFVAQQVQSVFYIFPLTWVKCLIKIIWSHEYLQSLM